MNDASDLTNRTNYSNGWAPVIVHLECHALLLPHPARAHPQVKRGFVNVNDLKVWVVHHPESKASHKVLLQITEFTSLILLLQEYNLWLFVSHS